MQPKKIKAGTKNLTDKVLIEKQFNTYYQNFKNDSKLFSEL